MEAPFLAAKLRPPQEASQQTVQEKSIEELTAEIKARYGIAGAGAGPRRFPIVLIRPSRYDADGYVVHWFRSAASSSPLTPLHRLLNNGLLRGILGSEVETELRSLDEEAHRIRPERLARELQGGRGLVILAAVTSSQLARAMDIALPLRIAGVSVCMEGAYVSGRVALQGAVSPELQEAMNLGVTLFAGAPTQERIDELVRDAWRGRLKPLYNTDERSTLAAEVLPMAATRRVRGRTGSNAVRFSAVDCSFCAVIPIDGGSAAGRSSAGQVEQNIRAQLQAGAGRFLLADKNIARYAEWEELFDRLIAMRERENLDIECTLQIDGVCHRVPGFMEKAARAGIRGVFLDLDLDSRPSAREEQAQDPIAACRLMLLEWKRAGMIVFARYAIGGEGKMPDAVPGEIRMLRSELPIDVLQPFSLSSRVDDEWARACRNAWKEFYAREHMEKILRRAVATGTDIENLMTVLLWFHGCVFYEKVEPVWGGSWRRRYRRDRRSSMDTDDPMTFHIADVIERLSKVIRRRALYARFRTFVKQLQAEPGARSYTDPALDPATASALLLPQVSATR